MPDTRSLSFRFAVPDEAELISAIDYEAAQRFADIGMVGIATARPMDVAFVRRKIEAAAIVVALENGIHCVGFVMFARGAEDFYIEELDVLTAWAGRRIGAALIERVAGLARTAQAQRLLLSTFRDVPWNAPYYQRLGFRPIADADLDDHLKARRADHIARGIDEAKRVFMWRAVDAMPA
ncbi:GNAT family N-acetyltransferase [Paraburkholderia sp. DHOC27]|uniref:GNAT family N-acetyltransferase n=1 Tax=Paraburkholderia sp. DHOC27 TaxID=2303330 RepID=UPI000E3D2AF3|nr:GNAT family N-acetyltransferase [Paraburkholderia sp. DHOC27]RFU44906.1 GNAT family N-acetyltransferase [Paraburkholderia sp. DHOC27]